MLWTLFVVMFGLWTLGIATSYTLGGFIHLFLVFALASMLIWMLQSRQLT